MTFSCCVLFFLLVSTCSHRVPTSPSQFYRVLPSFTSVDCGVIFFHTFLPALTGFQLVPPSFTGFYLVFLLVSYWVLSIVSYRLSLVSLSLSGFYLVLLQSIVVWSSFFCSLRKFAQVLGHWIALGFAHDWFLTLCSDFLWYDAVDFDWILIEHFNEICDHDHVQVMCCIFRKNPGNPSRNRSGIRRDAQDIGNRIPGFHSLNKTKIQSNPKELRLIREAWTKFGPVRPQKFPPVTLTMNLTRFRI